jgi:hypothetical protein
VQIKGKAGEITASDKSFTAFLEATERVLPLHFIPDDAPYRCFGFGVQH